MQKKSKHTITLFFINNKNVSGYIIEILHTLQGLKQTEHNGRKNKENEKK